MTQEIRLFINGNWVATKQKGKVMNKATGEPIAEFFEAGPSEIDAAVAAAQEAFKRKKLSP